MEDAISLAWAVRDAATSTPTRPSAGRSSRARSARRRARSSGSRASGATCSQDPRTFAFNLLTRSPPDHARRAADARPGLRRRRVGDGGRRCSRRSGCAALELANRVVVSPMDMYSSVDGTPGDFHLVHLGARGDRRRRAGDDRDDLHVAPTGGSRPAAAACTATSTRRRGSGSSTSCTRTRARRSAASSGTRGARARRSCMWEGEDQPLDEGNWPLIAPSPLPYLPGVSQVPREMTRADMDAVRDEFVAATRRAAAAGFDLLELHMAHGYLLSSFLSPLTNVREDEYGGRTGRAFPLEVFAACRAVWPAEKPMSRAHQRDRLGRRRLRRRRRGRVRAPAASRPAATSSTSRPARSRPTSSPPTGAASRRRTPTGSATRRASR